MELKYHTSADLFYDKNGVLYPNPTQSIAELEEMYCDAVSKYKISREKEAELLSNNVIEDDDLFFDIAMNNFNLESLISGLEWKIDLKLLHDANEL